MKKRASSPLPGRPVRGSSTGRPVMALLDLLGRRWALRVLWELRERPLTFRELVTACDELSASTLNERLAELRAAGIVEQGEGGYSVTRHGRALLEHLRGLDEWARAWGKRMAREAGTD